jgi:hypothetical protein
MQELRVLSQAAAGPLQVGLRDLSIRPFESWDHALESLGAAAESEPLLVVIDEFPELVAAMPELPSVIRAQWDRLRAQTNLKILLSGSAVRTVQAMQEYRAPLYGRFDLSLPLHPFWPHEAAMMLPATRSCRRSYASWTTSWVRDGRLPSACICAAWRFDGALGDEVVAVGPFWTAAADPTEIDAVVLAGRERVAVLAGEARWARRVDAGRIRRQLERKVEALPRVAPDLRYAVCARETVDNAADVMAFTAADVFDG